MRAAFKLSDYKGKNFCMHCDTKTKAKEFLEFLNKNGRIWKSGESYVPLDNWNYYKKETCYYFNQGTYGSNSVASSFGDIVLGFDNFCWDGGCKFMKKHTKRS